MKYVVALLLASFLLVTACDITENIDPVVDDQVPVDNATDEEVANEIMPELVDAVEVPEIGEMI